LHRPIEAITPFIPIGKEIERRSQKGEDISVFGNAGPVKYHPRKTANTRPILDENLVTMIDLRPCLRQFCARSGMDSLAAKETINGMWRRSRLAPEQFL
jgi:hypothetical protein